ncbi:MAG: Gfo/Idh/MocA family oxidoreductase [Verrucomicrobiota bacterium]|jgi:predicted dehydrogenase
MNPTRRSFLKNTAGAASAASLARPVHAAGSDILRVGLVGCGGRGTGAAQQALNADPGARLVAMADVFEDRLKLSLEAIKAGSPGKVDVPAKRQFVGFDAYRDLLASGVDVILLTTPPHFRPLHLRAAVEAGVHIFAEKPVATDAPGIRSVIESCRLAREKKLSLVSGLCLRYFYAFQESIKRIHDGALGEIHTLLANDYRGSIWMKPRQPDWTDMHWQMRNWYYFTWLSGDFNVEQHVHFLDLCSWAIGAYPDTALGMGGRHVRTGPEYGNIFDHHSVTYTYASGARLFSNTRQMKACKSNLSAQVVGSKGEAHFSERRRGVWIKNDQGTWFYEGEANKYYQTEHDELFASIRKGTAINNGDYMVKSTLLAIQGRMATYTGQEVSWEQAMNSKEDLSPEAYAWGPIETPRIAMPGLTKLI